MSQCDPGWSTAYIGLGSNLGDPERRIRRALEMMDDSDSMRIVRVSSLYRNPPMGPADQPEFVNAVAALRTGLTAPELLVALRRLELRLGRTRGRGQRWGPREIDLDILLYDNEQIELPDLKVPHPGISQRNFVLFPLLEIAPTLHVPGLGSVAELARRSDGATLRKI